MRVGRRGAGGCGASGTFEAEDLALACVTAEVLSRDLRKKNMHGALWSCTPGTSPRDIERLRSHVLACML